MKITALIVAAGTGLRAKTRLPKQYMELEGKTVLEHTALALKRHHMVDDVRIIINPDHTALYEKSMDWLSLAPPIIGGEQRQDSVYAGLKSLMDDKPDGVLIHDAARPFIDAAIITSAINGLESNVAVIPVTTIKDTVKVIEAGKITSTLERRNLFAAQTPQAFRYDEFMAAFEKAMESGLEFTDDAAVMEYSDFEVAAFSGSDINFKITTPEDLRRAVDVLKRRKKRQWMKSLENELFLVGMRMKQEISSP